MMGKYYRKIVKQGNGEKEDMIKKIMRGIIIKGKQETGHRKNRKKQENGKRENNRKLMKGKILTGNRKAGKKTIVRQ